ncbi:hypothetical protein AVT69_gp277 [Pseudomonas phage PhiPA3]|uniref:Uncharacterized protein 279 n=1 Tax=Pseudomonas phage PhiPA3 TaxID=998086 RepID=F8SJB5_BPPA3|nr:hypothetical protein AVT69_gp277 [Pseudomonas phage PhiPA3]AEH03702.1 hypothetical protein [Pseudomonas phage PhiPA3]
MSSDKSKKQYRHHHEQRHVKAQVAIWRFYNQQAASLDDRRLGRMRKEHALNCGRSHCMLCVNPRRTWGRKTLAEKVADIRFKEQQ